MATLAGGEPRWVKGVRLVMQVALPLALFLTSVRLTLTHAYVDLAYRMPGFPADPYGFTQADRLHWGNLSLDYLVNNAGIEFLGNLTFADGTPIYNARELTHMHDVKNLTKTALLLWESALLIIVLFSFWLWRTGHLASAWLALRNGALWTFGLMAALALALLVSFNFVFVEFHHIFFQGNSWLFLYSDTLIRLFPERFWEQVFGFITLVTVVAAGVIFVVSSSALRSPGQGRPAAAEPADSEPSADL
jgi:integral membrane protein (TIGR01906 family)